MATLASAALVSGLLVPERALQTYPVRPDGATVIELRGDDEVRIVDLHGGRVGFSPTSCVAPQFRRVRHPAKKGPHRGPRPVRH